MVEITLEIVRKAVLDFADAFRIYKELRTRLECLNDCPKANQKSIKGRLLTNILRRRMVEQYHQVRLTGAHLWKLKLHLAKHPTLEMKLKNEYDEHK